MRKRDRKAAEKEMKTSLAKINWAKCRSIWNTLMMKKKKIISIDTGLNEFIERELT